MSRLIYVPVMHSSAEMGSAAAGYKAAFVARFGEEQWRARGAEFDAIWQRIEGAVTALDLDWSKVKLFQDSLPVCGKEIALTRELGAQGSRNHRLLLKLIDRGATLVGTESPALLLDEYRLLQAPGHSEQKAADLLEARDQFIAERIETALGQDETAVLFMGALHRVANFLPPRIKVEYLAVRDR